MPSIIYPITASYRAQWQLWDAFRECIWQEFLDLFQTWTVEQADGKTIIEGCGAHMALRHLLLGGSDKTEAAARPVRRGHQAGLAGSRCARACLSASPRASSTACTRAGPTCTASR
ncbi:MAG: hypothetical protein V9H69_18495 [Anaerolineae bacterium]